MKGEQLSTTLPSDRGGQAVPRSISALLEFPKAEYRRSVTEKSDRLTLAIMKKDGERTGEPILSFYPNRNDVSKGPLSV